MGGGAVFGDTEGVNDSSSDCLASAPAPHDSGIAKRRIFVVEDHDFMRRNLIATLEREAALAVCGEADDAPAALAAIAASLPDLVLTDLTLKASSGLDLIKALRARLPALPVVATTMFDVRTSERRARDAGANVFVSKQDGPDALIAAIHAALRPDADSNRNAPPDSSSS